MATEITKVYDLAAIERANLGDRTRAQYSKALRNYLATGAALTDAGALELYAATLPTSSRSFLKAAVRLVTLDYQHNLKSSVAPENLALTQAALMRLEALNDAIKVHAPRGTKAHTWLSSVQVKQLMATCDDTLPGRRDWIILGLLVGAGLRREELADLDCSSVIDLPGKAGKTRWVLQVTGKGAKTRIIPISEHLAERLQAWCAEIRTGKIGRSLGQAVKLGESISTIAIFQIVRRHGAAIGKPTLDPHDLRRTYAQLGYEAGVPLTQLSKLLGHADIATTQRYLNLDLDLGVTASDFIPL
jgi:site-specific recombinase XerC